jgi:hypothetical protein
VPVAIKDDTDVAGELTCRGTAVEHRAEADAPVVALLRAAGAIIIGKTNVPELDAWGFTESMTFGATRDPSDLDRTPGGSSGGAAVAVATGMCGIEPPLRLVEWRISEVDDVYPRTSPLHSAPGTTRSVAGSPCKSGISGL